MEIHKLYSESNNFEKIENYNALLGCIKYNKTYNFYLMPIAWWILDYKKYDPKGSTNDNLNFRNNIFTVDDNSVNKFIQSIQEDIISIEDIIIIIAKYINTGNYDYSSLLFFIDFDEKLYLHAFCDIELENYLPKMWNGRLDKPLNYLPNNFTLLWGDK